MPYIMQRLEEIQGKWPNIFFFLYFLRFLNDKLSHPDIASEKYWRHFVFIYLFNVLSKYLCEHLYNSYGYIFLADGIFKENTINYSLAIIIISVTSFLC